MKLVMASNNKHKVKEIKTILDSSKFEILSLQDLNLDIEVHEDQSTFEENARKKAAEVDGIIKLPTFADDSGLMVEKLNGEPGVLSARYAGENCLYDDNNKKLLKKLGRIAKPWKAQFICVINFKDEKFDEIFIGTCDGEIVDEPRGSNGFGYDPIFKPNGYEKTFAELEPQEKNKISHRSRALMKFKEFLDENF